MKEPTPRTLRTIMFVALIFIALASTAQAGSLTVAPVRVALSDADKVQTVVVRNNGTGLARVQLRVFAWRQVGGEEVLEDTRDILVNPVIFELSPGAEQVARFGLRVVQGPIEKSYRVVVDEIPGARASEPGQIRTLLRIVMPIFVAPTAPTHRLTWSQHDGARLTLHNRGNTHVQLRLLSVTDAATRSVVRQEMSTYLLAGTTRNVPLGQPQMPASSQSLTVHALTDATVTPVVVDRETDADPTPKL